MKPVLLGAIVAPLAIGAAWAQGIAPATPAPQTICLDTYRIDHTDVPDESTIVFHMRGGKTWVNKLPVRCSGLRFHGFSYVVRGPNEICGNLQSIRVLETGNYCLLGPFTPAPEESSPQSDTPDD
jgi:hypothetical protein